MKTHTQKMNFQKYQKNAIAATFGTSAHRSMVDGSVVEIGINCPSESRLMLKVKPATSLRKIVQAYCEAKGLRRHSLRFLFDGVRIAEDATVLSLGLEQGDW